MIVVAGEALIDLILQPDLRLTAVAGGGPFNTARTIGRLGGDVAFVGRLSTDRFGSMLRDALAADGVDLSLAAPTDAPTTLAVAELDDDRRRDLPIPHGRDVGARAVDLDDVMAAIRREPDAVHVGTLGPRPRADGLRPGRRASVSSPTTRS